MDYPVMSGPPLLKWRRPAGWSWLPSAQRDPLITTSWGTGELIRHALDAGVKHIIIGIGGSATNDGGAGMVQALGAKLLDSHGSGIGYGGGALPQLAKIEIADLDKRLVQCRIEVACDVTNPLTGEEGASAVFGPQKGRHARDDRTLDNALAHYAEIIARDLDIDVLNLAGGGAAGGMGAALYAFCGAELRQGIEIVTDALGLADQVPDADLVITGEGRIDSQTVHGKVPVGVAKVAKRFNKPVIGIAGSLTADVGVVHDHGIDAVFSVLYTICSLEDALENASAECPHDGKEYRGGAESGAGVVGEAVRFSPHPSPLPQAGEGADGARIWISRCSSGSHRTVPSPAGRGSG